MQNKLNRVNNNSMSSLHSSVLPQDLNRSFNPTRSLQTLNLFSKQKTAYEMRLGTPIKFKNRGGLQ